MILGNKIQKICGLLLQGRIQIFSSKALIDGSNAPLEGIILLIAEERTGIAKLHIIDHFSALFVSQNIGRLIPFRPLHILMVVGVQQIQRLAVAFHHR